EGPVNFKTTPEEFKKIRATAEKIGIQLSGFATGLYWGANGASADPKVRQKAAAILDRQLECAEALGIDAVLVVPAAVGVDFIPGGEVVPYDVAFDRAKDLIRQALPAAEKRKVTIGIENVWNKFLLSPLEMRDFVDSFKSERVKCYYDVGNTLATGYPEHWIPILGNRIARVHFKDYRRAVGSVEGFVDLLSGNVNWPAVVKALRDVKYQGWVTAEMIPPVPFYTYAPETLIYNTAKAMKAIFSL
ncbi:MAG: sugar phosphate isomerase/epimerase, partial [Spirochaetia bacterium]|nr:sugar phosphate isomerase/epimerase [Spirochaetia bacterium]